MVGGISQNGVNPYKKTGYEKWRMPTARMGCAFWGRVTLPLDAVQLDHRNKSESDQG